MTAFTKDYRKIGKTEYYVSIGDDINDSLVTVETKSFDTLEEAQTWGRALLLAGDGIDAWIRKGTYVESEPWDDDEYGLIYDADWEFDDLWDMYLFNAHGEWTLEEG